MSGAPAILQLISSSGFFGAERVLLELSLHLHRQGWPVQVGALEAPGMGRIALLEQARQAGLRTVRFPCRGGFDARAMARIRDHVRANAIDVVHSHGYKSNIYLFLALGNRRTTRLVSTCHNWLTDSLKLMVYELADKLVLQQFHHVVGVSPPLDRELAAAGIPRSCRSVVDNGLDLEAGLDAAERDALRQSLGVGPSDLLLLTIGRLDPWKAYDRLLQAVSRLDPALPLRLVLVGDGELRAPLQQQARQLGVGDRVLFAGYRDDVGRLLLAADMFVISSRKEGLPMVLLEALAARLPVVATRVGAIPDALGEDGLLVPPEDPEALARAIADLAGAPGQRRSLAARGHAAYRARFSRQAMGRRYEALYRRLIAARGENDR